MSRPESNGFRDLLVWQQAMDLAVECHKITQSFPREELYGLTSQIRKAADSVPANIAEGSGRGTRKDFIQFLRMSKGSLRELETHLILATRVGYLTNEQMAEVEAKITSVSKLLNRLIASLQT